jgi:molybdenum cofactor cytidylyltransferase
MDGRSVKAAAVLLAAGLSRRMGERNKLLIEIDGEPLVRRTAKTYLQAGVEVYAVLGHEVELVREALAGLPVSCVENPEYEEGQPSSVRAGVDSLGGAYDAILIALADQPALTPGDVSDLIRAFSESGGGRIVIPYCGERRGNPAVFPAAIVAKIRAAGRYAAYRGFIDKHPELTFRYQAANDHYAIDIDTPEDLAAFQPDPKRAQHRK